MVLHAQQFFSFQCSDFVLAGVGQEASAGELGGSAQTRSGKNETCHSSYKPPGRGFVTDCVCFKSSHRRSNYLDRPEQRPGQRH